LRLTATLGSHIAAAAATRSKSTAAGFALEATTATLTTSTAIGPATVGTAAAGSISITKVARADATLFHEDLFRSHLMGVSSHGRRVASLVGKVHECAVL
jgi:hypothetical protein